MIITNKHGLPRAFALAVANDPYDRGKSRISVTGLIAPPRARVIKELHEAEISEDVSDRIWALFGSAVHSILERAGELAGSRVEERLFARTCGWRISGKFDECRVADATLSDFKVTSVWTRIYGSRIKEWTEQLNLLACLCRLNNIEPIDNLSIICLYRDWQESRTGEGGYPAAAVEEVTIECLPQKDARKLMRSLVKRHQQAEVRLPLCTDEERWYNQRTGVYNRCRRYCQAAPWCEQ